MNLRGIPLILTVVNLALLSTLLARSPKAAPLNELPVLRGRALEIVDDQGRVRASINVYPKNPNFRTADGRPYPETVLLRLINSYGGPNVKLSASDDGAALGLRGVTDPTDIQIIADRDETFLNMTNRDGKKQSLKPGSRNGPPPFFAADSRRHQSSDIRCRSHSASERLARAGLALAGIPPSPAGRIARRGPSHARGEA